MDVNGPFLDLNHGERSITPDSWSIEPDLSIRITVVAGSDHGVDMLDSFGSTSIARVATEATNPQGRLGEDEHSNPSSDAANRAVRTHPIAWKISDGAVHLADAAPEVEGVEPAAMEQAWAHHTHQSLYQLRLPVALGDVAHTLSLGALVTITHRGPHGAAVCARFDTAVAFKSWMDAQGRPVGEQPKEPRLFKWMDDLDDETLRARFAKALAQTITVLPGILKEGPSIWDGDPL
jgi:hypothetical protein